MTASAMQMGKNGSLNVKDKHKASVRSRFTIDVIVRVCTMNLARQVPVVQAFPNQPSQISYETISDEASSLFGEELEVVGHNECYHPRVEVSRQNRYLTRGFGEY